MDSKPILDLNAFDPRNAGDFGSELDERLRRRARLFGAASVLFYDKPLDFVRGAGCWLYDGEGAAYLDAYNNVPSVGHCHPHVVDAVARQLGQLNVHNRYLNDRVLDYAERLLATMPAALSNVTFTCTGSESNDLALRLAAEFTQSRGIIVTESAYHGNTAWVTEVSPTLNGGATLPQVRYVSAPRAGDGPAGDVATSFARRVTDAIGDLKKSGMGFSALLLDSIFSSDGVFPDPAGFLRPSIDAVHQAGGLFIADEVQSGFGRTGDALWGFDRHGVLPDVITLGKPMGNGYPMGAVITRPEILERFCARFGYFNTFGGSAVAAAAGGAVLDVLEREQLMQNAADVGAHLKRGLGALAARHAEIGAVRGAGFYVGVDMVQRISGDEASPAPALAQATINALRERRVLIGAAGKFGHTLKIRPPLCFSVANADHLLAALGDVLERRGSAGRR